MKRYKAYIFDMDLTLLNTLVSANKAYKAGFQAIGISYDESTVTHHLSIPLTGSYDECINPTGDFETFRTAFVNVADQTLVNDSFFYEDSLRLINRLVKLGAKLGVVTNRDYNNVCKILEKAGIRQYFETIVTSDRVKELKPSKEPILLALKELGVTNKEAVYIGDAKNDYLAATNASVDFISIERYNNCNFNPPIVVKSFDEIN